MLTHTPEGNKSLIHTHLNYAVIVSPPAAPSAASASATVRNYVARQPQEPSRTDVSKVTVFDIENKFIAYSGVFANGVRSVFSEWGNIYVLTNGGQVCPPLKVMKAVANSSQADLLRREINP